VITVSEIRPCLDKRTIQFVKVREAAFPVIVLQVTPSDLQPYIAGQLKFEPDRSNCLKNFFNSGGG
jgi:hypothetical protein